MEKVSKLCIISQKPFIQILPKERQDDYLNTKYYLSKFIEKERELLELGSLKTVEDFCSLITDGMHYKPTYVDEGIIFISVKDISSGEIDFSETLNILKSDHLKNLRCAPKPGDVLLSKVGTIGKVVQVPEDSPEFNIYVSVALLRPKKAIDSAFLTLFLTSDTALFQAERILKGVGTPDLHLSDIKSILVPDIEDKRKELILLRYKAIINFVKRFDILLKKVEEQQLLASNMIDDFFSKELGINSPQQCNDKIRVLQLFNQADRLDWEYYSPSHISTEEQLAESLITVSRLYNHGHLITEAIKPTETPKQAFQLVKVKWHAKGAVPREIKQGNEISGPLKKVCSNDIIISRIDSTQRAVAVIPPELDGAYVSNEFFVIRLDKGTLLPNLLVRIMTTKRYVSYFFSQKTGTTKRLRLDEDVILNMPLPDVKLDAQYQILLKLSELDKKIAELNQQEANLVNLQEQILAAAKANIFDLLDDEKYQRILAMADEVLRTGITPEVAA